MTPVAWLLLATVLVGNTAGQLLLKAAAVRADRAGGDHWPALLREPVLWLGLSIYAVEFFVWLAFLSVVPLWLGVMVACIDLPLVMLGGRVFFGERITVARVCAISLIAIGVLLISQGGA